MSKDELKSFIPDTAKEWSFIGSSITRLGTLMSGVLLFESNKYWVLTSLILTWLGYEVSEYFKLNLTNGKEDQPS